MDPFNSTKQQIRSVIEWKNPHPESLFSQWTDRGDEIKKATKLIISSGQGCIFVYKGNVKAVMTQPCHVDLQQDNLSFWTTINHFMQFFESEHDVGLYFFKTSTLLNQKWGTTSVINYKDPQYKIPIGLHAFGNYSYRITDPNNFFTYIIGIHSDFFTDDFKAMIASRIIYPISNFLAESRFSYTDIDANHTEIAKELSHKLIETFAKLGFKITDFYIEGTSFDDKTLKQINRIAEIAEEAHAAELVSLDYASILQLEDLRDAARNETGLAGMGVGLGADIGLGESVAQKFHSQQYYTTPVLDDSMIKLEKLKKMVTAELITEDEYKAKKQQILEDF
ncbi:MAG: SPFH domain-containing protein [Methylococcales bacterium]|nr:SPFH domain-containing protein [Methylococcales bacterium]